MSKGWQNMKLCDVGEIVTGNTPKTSDKRNYFSNDYSFFKPSDLANNSLTVLEKSENFISEIAFTNSRQLPPGALLVTCIGTIGNVGITTELSTCNQQINAIIPNEEIDVRFLGYSILHMRPYLKHMANAPVVPIINKSNFSSIPIPIPPLPTQHQIVAELDTLNSIIDKKKEQLNELDNLAQATFYDMFGDPVENEKGWEVNKLGEVGELGRGVSKNRPRNSPDLLGGDIPLIQTGDIANSGLYILIHSQTYSQKGLEQSKLWKKGTLCITIAANIGKTAIMSYDACFPDSVVGFISNEDIIKNIFVHYYFLWIQQELEDNAPQVAQKNINLKILNNLDIIVPPLPLQTQFVEKIKHIEQQKALIQRSIDDVQQLFDYTMDKYFN